MREGARDFGNENWDFGNEKFHCGSFVVTVYHRAHEKKLRHSRVGAHEKNLQQGSLSAHEKNLQQECG